MWTWLKRTQDKPEKVVATVVEGFVKILFETRNADAEKVIESLWDISATMIVEEERWVRALASNCWCDGYRYFFQKWLTQREDKIKSMVRAQKATSSSSSNFMVQILQDMGSFYNTEDWPQLTKSFIDHFALSKRLNSIWLMLFIQSCATSTQLWKIQSDKSLLTVQS